MAIALTSIGAIVSYGTGKTGTFKKIPGITEIPEMNPTPDMLDTTSLDNQEYTSGVAGLKTLDVLTFGARFSQELFTTMQEINENDTVYIQIQIQKLDKACFIQCQPSPLGLPAVSTNSVIDASLYFTPVGEPEWATPIAPTT